MTRAAPAAAHPAPLASLAPAPAPYRAVDAAIAAYAARTTRSLERGAVDAVAALVEPRAVDPTFALRTLERLVETLAGFMLGHVVRQLATATRRWYGDAIAREVLGALRSELSPFDAVDDTTTASGCGTTSTRARPLAAELGARLHVRICQMPRRIAGVMTAIRSTLERTTSDARVAELGVVLGLLERDEPVGEPLAREVAAGWQHFGDILAGTPRPTTSPMWAAWSRRVRGEPEPSPRPAAARARGIIMVVG